MPNPKNIKKAKSFLYGQELIFLDHKKIVSITSLLIFLGIFFILINDINALDYKAQIGIGKFSGEVEIGPNSIGEFIIEIYKYAVGVVGILATIVIMWGGVRWLTAGGDSSAVKDAKEWISGAITGLILVMTSYMILYFVNPDLVVFKPIVIDEIKDNTNTKTEEEVVFCTDKGGFCSDGNDPCCPNLTCNKSLEKPICE